MGVGPLLASAFVATVADAHAAKSRRWLSACIGLVPKQNSSEGKQKNMARPIHIKEKKSTEAQFTSDASHTFIFYNAKTVGCLNALGLAAPSTLSVKLRAPREAKLRQERGNGSEMCSLVALYT